MLAKITHRKKNRKIFTKYFPPGTGRWKETPTAGLPGFRGWYVMLRLSHEYLDWRVGEGGDYHAAYSSLEGGYAVVSRHCPEFGSVEVVEAHIFKVVQAGDGDETVVAVCQDAAHLGNLNHVGGDVIALRIRQEEEACFSHIGIVKSLGRGINGNLIAGISIVPE